MARTMYNLRLKQLWNTRQTFFCAIYSKNFGIYVVQTGVKMFERSKWTFNNRKFNGISVCLELSYEKSWHERVANRTLRSRMSISKLSKLRDVDQELLQFIVRNFNLKDIEKDHSLCSYKSSSQPGSLHNKFQAFNLSKSEINLMKNHSAVWKSVTYKIYVALIFFYRQTFFFHFPQQIS